MSVKTNKPTHSKTSKSEIYFKDRLPLTIASDYLKPDNDPKQITTKSFFSSKSTRNKDNKRAKEDNKLKELKRSASMTSWKENTCKLIAPSQTISSSEPRPPAGRTLGLTFAPRTKDDAEQVVRETDRNFVLMIQLFKILMENQLLIEIPNEFLALNVKVIKNC